MSVCLPQADRPNILTFLRKHKNEQASIQKPDGSYPQLSIILAVIDHIHGCVVVKIRRPAQRDTVLLLVDSILRTVEKKLHRLSVYTICGGIQTKSGEPKPAAFPYFLFPACHFLPYLMISEIVPAPTVLPPSRIAKRRPFSIATGVCSVIASSMLSPGMHISVPSGSFADPVTSVVRK